MCKERGSQPVFYAYPLGDDMKGSLVCNVSKEGNFQRFKQISDPQAIKKHFHIGFAEEHLCTCLQ